MRVIWMPWGRNFRRYRLPVAVGRSYVRAGDWALAWGRGRP